MVLFADKSTNVVLLFILSLLRDFYEVGSFLWGSFALTCLFCELCLATSPHIYQIVHPLILLHVSFSILCCYYPISANVGVGAYPHGSSREIDAMMRSSCHKILTTSRSRGLQVCVLYQNDDVPYIKIFPIIFSVGSLILTS